MLPASPACRPPVPAGTGGGRCSWVPVRARPRGGDGTGCVPSPPAPPCAHLSVFEVLVPGRQHALQLGADDHPALPRPSAPLHSKEGQGGGKTALVFAIRAEVRAWCTRHCCTPAALAWMKLNWPQAAAACLLQTSHCGVSCGAAGGRRLGFELPAGDGAGSHAEKCVYALWSLVGCSGAHLIKNQRGAARARETGAHERASEDGSLSGRTVDVEQRLKAKRARCEAPRGRLQGVEVSCVSAARLRASESVVDSTN